MTKWTTLPGKTGACLNLSKMIPDSTDVAGLTFKGPTLAVEALERDD